MDNLYDSMKLSELLLGKKAYIVEPPSKHIWIPRVKAIPKKWRM